MGCLPLLLLFLLGTLIGYLVDGDTGMLWGSGIGWRGRWAITVTIVAVVFGFIPSRCFVKQQTDVLAGRNRFQRLAKLMFVRLGS